MKALELLTDTVAAHGVEIVFGLIGDANLFWVGDYINRCGGKYVAAAHESSAVNMATGYAWTAGHVGVATVTHGPGLTNTVTSLTESAGMRIPLVLIAGDTASTAKHHLQDIAQHDVIRPTGAGFEHVRSPDSISEDFAAAYRRARLEHRPIVLNVPADVYWIETRSSVVSPLPVPDGRFAAGQQDLDDALGVSANATRPIILAGMGASDGTTRATILKLARALGAPLVTSLRAKDLFRGDDLDCGVLGSIGDQRAVAAVERSDCVLAFGASLNGHTTMEGTLLRGKRVVQCDVDLENLGRHVRVDVAVLADAATFAEQMIEMLRSVDHTPSTWSRPLVAPPKNEEPQTTSRDDQLDMRLALSRFDDALPADRVIVSDAGRFAYYVPTLLHAPNPASWVYAWGGFGAIGLGMGTAIGAAFSDRSRPTVLITGDGGFMLGGLAEFATACREELDLVVIVCNDSAYGAEFIQFTARGLDPRISTFRWPEFAVVAQSLGGRGITVSTPTELDDAIGELEYRTSPLLIDLKLKPEAIGQPY